MRQKGQTGAEGWRRKESTASPKSLADPEGNHFANYMNEASF